MTDSPHYCAIVVTYFPGEDLAQNLRAIVAECGQAIVVDNGSGVEACRKIEQIEGVELVALESNRGVAAALNLGARLAAERGFRWAITFDQDSCPQPGFAAALRATQVSFPRAAIIGANIEDSGLRRGACWLRPHAKCGIFFERVECDDADLTDVTMVVTSGALTDLECWQKIGGFTEELFIDFVDTDYCLRCRAIGYTIAVSSGARMLHRLGRREARRFAGRMFYPTNHPPFRHYYVARNRVRMIRRHWHALHWLLFEVAATVMWSFRIVAFEQQKIPKLRAMLLGTWDGLRGRSGPCPAERWQALQPSGAAPL